MFHTYLLLQKPHSHPKARDLGHFLKVLLVAGKSLSLQERFQMAIKDPNASLGSNACHFDSVLTLRPSFLL
jgi:hypothetical protein